MIFHLTDKKNIDTLYRYINRESIEEDSSMQPYNVVIMFFFSLCLWIYARCIALAQIGALIAEEKDNKHK